VCKSLGGMIVGYAPCWCYNTNMEVMRDPPRTEAMELKLLFIYGSELFCAGPQKHPEQRGYCFGLFLPQGPEAETPRGLYADSKSGDCWWRTLFMYLTDAITPTMAVMAVKKSPGFTVGAFK
jgi:hypothetical protein